MGVNDVDVFSEGSSRAYPTCYAVDGSAVTSATAAEQLDRDNPWHGLRVFRGKRARVLPRA